ncbi:succinate dehydrogenase, cytochrome b556 subunit [Maritimibacter sp. UBA3975]|uniref:succinate dehydrogenase, cytochrome b556 subunit n=1 Tax=Maritimibacter sp. UBA3975 TaxID=1946833 RepID=UPI000C09BF21|nr:succinate dehydrogenase, cytochrome b556 subunit [Maritimibacter sp. UBA3975]MAM62074.1 succinate dehydrogenase, cytochrome b556 subunit [Maritimibacter sp.]|tara:strand:+ start:4932 stop:5315 length:384 start_codon:yes stop_codon:yes gene_type:complete
MADVNPGNRPLSPHLQVYRWPLNMALSILHRITGTAMGVTGVLIVWYFLALATGPDYFETASAVLTSWFGDIVLFLSVCALWLHFANGVRHLIWDTGSHFGLKTSKRSAYIGIGFAVVMVIVTIIVG